MRPVACKFCLGAEEENPKYEGRLSTRKKTKKQKTKTAQAEKKVGLRRARTDSGQFTAQ